MLLILFDRGIQTAFNGQLQSCDGGPIFGDSDIHRPLRHCLLLGTVSIVMTLMRRCYNVVMLL